MYSNKIAADTPLSIFLPFKELKRQNIKSISESVIPDSDFKQLTRLLRKDIQLTNTKIYQFCLMKLGPRSQAFQRYFKQGNNCKQYYAFLKYMFSKIKQNPFYFLVSAQNQSSIIPTEKSTISITNIGINQRQAIEVWVKQSIENLLRNALVNAFDSYDQKKEKIKKNLIKVKQIMNKYIQQNFKGKLKIINQDNLKPQIHLVKEVILEKLGFELLLLVALNIKFNNQNYFPSFQLQKSKNYISDQKSSFKSHFSCREQLARYSNYGSSSYKPSRSEINQTTNANPHKKLSIIDEFSNIQKPKIGIDILNKYKSLIKKSSQTQISKQASQISVKKSQYAAKIEVNITGDTKNKSYLTKSYQGSAKSNVMEQTQSIEDHGQFFKRGKNKYSKVTNANALAQNHMDVSQAANKAEKNIYFPQQKVIQQKPNSIIQIKGKNEQNMMKSQKKMRILGAEDGTNRQKNPQQKIIQQKYNSIVEIKAKDEQNIRGSNKQSNNSASSQLPNQQQQTKKKKITIKNVKKQGK